MIRKVLGISVIMMFLSCSAYSMSLSNVINIAIKNSDTVKSADAQIRSQQYKAESVYKLNYPVLSTSYGYVRMKDRSSTSFGGHTFYMNHHNNFKWDINLRMPLFTGFKLSNAYKLERLGIHIDKLKKEEAVLDLIYNTSKSYYELLFARKMELVMITRLKSLKSHLNDAEKFYKVGLIPKNDLLKSKTAELSAEQALQSAKNNVLLSASNLNRLMGKSFDSKISIDDVQNSLPAEIIVGNIKGDYNNDMEKKLEIYSEIKRPAISIINSNMNKLGYAKRIASSSYYPHIGIKADYYREGNHFDVSKNQDIPFLPYRNASIGARIDWELFNWGKTADEIDMYRSREISVLFIKKDMERKIALGVRRAFLNTKLAYDNKKVSTAEITQAKENLRITDLRYKNGITTSTELLDAESYFVAAEAHYYGSLYNYFINLSLLKRQVGVK